MAAPGGRQGAAGLSRTAVTGWRALPAAVRRAVWGAEIIIVHNAEKIKLKALRRGVIMAGVAHKECIKS